jgi:hypothetical protein
VPKSLDSDRSKMPVGESLCNLCIKHADIRGVTTIMLLAGLAATMLSSSPIIANGQQSDTIKVDETYSPYILILGIIAVIAAFLVLFIEPKLQRKEALKRGINTLKLALDDNRNDLLDKDRKFQIVDRKGQCEHTSRIA